jgi:hypothetical protein
MLASIELDGTLRHVAGIPRTSSPNYQDAGLYEGDGGLATEAHLNTPGGLAVLPSGVIYFADTFNHVIRSINTDGIISTVWGQGSRGFASDGSLLSYPSSIVLVGDDLFITDNGNGLASRIRLSAIDRMGYITGRNLTPISPLHSVPAGDVKFEFDRHVLDRRYYFQLYLDPGPAVWQGYIDTNTWQTELAPGRYRWRVTPMTQIDGRNVFAPPNEWVRITVGPNE